MNVDSAMLTEAKSEILDDSEDKDRISEDCSTQ